MVYNATTTAVQFIKDVVDKHGICCREKLVELVCEELENKWDADEWEQRSAEIGLGTTRQIQVAVNAYWDAVAEGRIASSRQHCSGVSDGALNLIGQIVRESGLHDRMDILEAVCTHLEQKFEGNTLEYHLRQMNMNSTADVLYAIDLYTIGQEYNVFETKPEKSGKRSKTA